MTERNTKERLRQTIQGWLQRKRNGKDGRQAGSPEFQKARTRYCTLEEKLAEKLNEEEKRY